MATLPSVIEKTLAYRVLRYTPNLVRDEWVNIGVLVFDPATGERRLRMIEEPQEYARVRRLHPKADESLLRGLRDDLENRFATAAQLFAGNGSAGSNGGVENGSAQQASADWLKLLAKWDETLSNALQLAPQKGVRAEEFTFAGDPMRIDFAYRRNGTRGFLQTLSVSRQPGEVKSLAYNFEHIRNKVPASEFTAITDVQLLAENMSQRFVRDTLRDVGAEALPLEGLAVWAAKMRPLIQ